jgi:hypothetical protein
MATATIATSVAVNVTTSIITTTNISTTPTDYTTAIANGGIASTNIASTITSWTSLSSSIAAAAGKAVTLTLSTPFDMTGFQFGSAIDMQIAQTSITILGNAAVFDATCTTTAPTGTESTSLIPLLLYSYHYCRDRYGINITHTTTAVLVPLLPGGEQTASSSWARPWRW